ncbi:MAG: hypothetical protein M1818_006099 [Claussenomyces sp. TS43310]|nr:MAG: hypothetical protein M1818_006099 [Claussenomyces sp. TS43310]
MKAVILLLEAMEKHKWMIHIDDRQRSPEETTGIYNQSFFWWLNPLMKRGFRGILQISDLFSMDESMSSEVLNTRFWTLWNKSSRQGKYKLAFVMVRLLKWPILSVIIPRLVLVAFTICQPLLLKTFLNFLQNPQQSQSIGYGLIGAYGLVYLGMALSTGFYRHRSVRCLAIIRGTLVSAVFVKTTEISITALDNSAAVTLMSTDVERSVMALREVHELWANAIQVGIATYLLEAELGAACVVPIAVALSTALVMFKLSSFTQKLQLVWVQKIQERIGITSNMLGSMKGIKMTGLTQKMSDSIVGLRETEIKDAEPFRLLNAGSATLGSVPLMITPIITFAIYNVIATKSGRTLDDNRLFTALSLLLLVTQPLFTTFAGFVELLSTLGCIERIEKFLRAAPRRDHRMIHGPSPSLSQRVSVLPPLESPNSYTSGPGVLTVRDGSFGWSNDGDPILHDINLSIRPSKLTLLIGPVASGKTTLLKALLGETPSSKGFVHLLTSQVSWCEQTPWLINASVQKNIIGFDTFDSDLYQAAIDGADLHNDIASFPNGDQTLIGSKGISLSGGQKSRLQIARAVYAKKSIAFFDDIFSGLDAATEEIIFDRLFGMRGLFRRWGTTVIVATHSEQGSFTELNASSGYVHSLRVEHNKDTRTTQSETPDAGQKPTYVPGKVRVDLRGETLGGKARQVGDWAVYRYYLRIIGWRHSAIFFLVQVSNAFFSSFPTVWLKWWASSNEAHPNRRAGFYLGVYTAFQLVGLIVAGALPLFTFTVMAARSGIQLHNITLKTVMSAPMAFFAATDIGSITTRFSQDIQLIDSQLPLALMCVGSYLFICIAQATLIASASYWIALSYPPLLALYYGVQKYYLRTSRQLRILDLELKAPLYTQFLETLGGLTTIRAFKWEKDSICLNHKLVDQSQKPFYLLLMIQRWLTLVLDLSSMVLAIIVTTVAVQTRNTVSVGFTGVSLVQIISLTNYLRMMLSFWAQLETSIGAVARVKHFEAKTASENLPEENVEPAADWPNEGSIKIDGLSASYGTDENVNEDKALCDVSLSIRPGEKIGICGRSGSGKSSLVLALFRMIELTGGKITIDGLDVSTVRRNALRSRLNAIAQEPFLLHGSLRRNLDPHERASDAACIAALQHVQLWAGLEARGAAQLDAPLGPDALSQGQRQLLCLARALLRPGRIVVLDEATSSVDAGTEALMQRVIRAHFAHHTIVAIAHRLHTIRDFDRVVVMDGGRIVECDTPDNLLRDPESSFRLLHDAAGRSAAAVDANG